ncbi:hypothetical protein M9H77_11184 [Catharanthus roseus]|uniref:Uncharacterized protein n=1 Tax=Catharanthus roseus TaxID=4058 RepID=A0ACC0BDR8_CATRO|nr:hypothetical protein M9H77_11184 [Catharanthus roseus]
MIKVINANVRREENYEEGGSSKGGNTGKGKGKRVANEARIPERFISVKEAANFEEWKRKRRKVAPGHRVDLSDMESMDVDDEECEEEPEEENFRREMRQKKSQERVEEGQTSGSMSQLMDMIAFMQASLNNHFDALDGKISDIQEKFIRRTKNAQKESQG